MIHEDWLIHKVHKNYYTIISWEKIYINCYINSMRENSQKLLYYVWKFHEKYCTSMCKNSQKLLQE